MKSFFKVKSISSLEFEYIPSPNKGILLLYFSNEKTIIPQEKRQKK